MRKVLVLTSAFLFAAAMAVAQDTNQSTMSGTPQAGTSSSNLRGCLTAGGDQFKLTTDVGAKVVNLSVDKQTATPYVAHEVEVQGATGSDGNFRVDRIQDIADHCGHSAADNSTSATPDSAAAANTQSAGNQSSAVASPSATTTTPDNAAPATSANAANPSTSPDQTAASTSMPNSTTSSPSNTDVTAQNATPSNAQSSIATQPSAQPAPDSNAVATEQKPADQSATSATPSTTADQNATSSTTSTTDQKATQSSTTTTTDQSAAAAPADENAGKSQLPQTGSPLPLLALLGLGSLGAGYVSRKRK